MAKALTTHPHVVTVTVRGGRNTATCTCSWATDAVSSGGLGVAVAGHLGLRIGLKPSPRCPHTSVCYDDHGHTDGCLLDWLDQ